jgi:hypothetical protein
MVNTPPQFAPQPAAEPVRQYESRFPEPGFADQQFHHQDFHRPVEFHPPPNFSSHRASSTSFVPKPPIEDIKFNPQKLESTFSVKRPPEIVNFTPEPDVPHPVVIPSVNEKDLAAPVKSLPSPKFEPKKLAGGFPEVVVPPKRVEKVIEQVKGENNEEGGLGPGFRPRLISEAFPKMAKLRTPDIVLHDSGRARFWSGS